MAAPERVLELAGAAEEEPVGDEVEAAEELEAVAAAAAWPAAVASSCVALPQTYWDLQFC